MGESDGRDFGVLDDDDFDDDAFLAAWDAVDQQAANLLVDSCSDVLTAAPPMGALSRAVGDLRAGVEAQRWPCDYFASACGWGDRVPVGDDLVVWVTAAASSISPLNDPGTDPELQAAVMALQHADWLAIVVGSVRRGAGTTIDADSVSRDLETMDEIDGDSDDPDGDLSVLSLALTVLTPLWQAIGVLDEDERLTELGRWGLPQALRIAWVGDDGIGLGQLSAPEAAVALELLEDMRAATVGELRRELAKKSVFADEDILRASLIWRLEVYQFDDESLGHVPTLADGLILTHRATREELELGVLVDGVDLNLFGLLALDGMSYAAGGEVRSRFRDEHPLPAGATSGLVGPSGWLAGIEAGDLVGLRYAAGAIALERVTAQDESGAALLAAAARVAATKVADDPHVDLPGVAGAEVVFRTRRENPGSLVEPTRPLSELAVDVGLEVHGDSVGVQGTPWYGEPTWLPEDDRAAYRHWCAVMRSHRLSDELPPDHELVALAEDLSPLVLDLAAVEVTADPGCQPLVAAMAEAVVGRRRAVPLYLLARAAEGRGDGPAILAHLEDAVTADPAHVDALGDLADLRAIAGDAREAHRLYGLSGLDAHAPEMRALATFLQVPDGEVGRNRPCPCGSGKKYKVCHGQTARHPLSVRAGWLWFKIESFVQRGANRELLLDWAEIASSAPREERETVVRAMADPLTQDFATFDGGLLADFVDTYGFLMPDDERSLAETWAASGRRLVEVVEVLPMRGIRGTDLVTREHLEIRDRRIATQLQAKDLLVGRPLPDGEGSLRFQADPVSLPRPMRSRLLTLMREAAPPEAVLASLAPQRLAPRLTTTEGQELVMCTARYDLDDADQAWARLSGALAPADDDELVAYADMEGQGRVIRGRLLRAGDLVTIETNAVERLRDLQRLLHLNAPTARLVDESTRPMESMLGDELIGMGASDPVELPPDVVEEIARQHEERWLADTIPALRGRTPREAAANPELRPELEALLDDFEWSERRDSQAITMNTMRLRQALGLAPQ